MERRHSPDETDSQEVPLDLLTLQPLKESPPAPEEEEVRPTPSAGAFSIDKWLKKVPGGYLDGLEYGHRPENSIPQIVREDGLLRQVYLIDLALAAGAEKASVRVASGLANMADDDASMVFLSTQTLDEARHFEAFANRFREMDLKDETREHLTENYMLPAYREFLDLLQEGVEARDFETGLVGLNIILEGMAFPLYGYQMRYWKTFDPGLADVIEGAFKDEVRHVGFGEKHLAYRLNRDPSARGRVQKRVNDLGLKMRDVFTQFLRYFIGFYDLAVRDHMDLVGGVEIIPGRMLADTSAEEQARWLEAEILKVHRKRLARIGLDYIS